MESRRAGRIRNQADARSQAGRSATDNRQGSRRGDVAPRLVTLGQPHLKICEAPLAKRRRCEILIGKPPEHIAFRKCWKRLGLAWISTEYIDNTALNHISRPRAIVFSAKRRRNGMGARRAKPCVGEVCSPRKLAEQNGAGRACRGPRSHPIIINIARRTSEIDLRLKHEPLRRDSPMSRIRMPRAAHVFMAAQFKS